MSATTVGDLLDRAETLTRSLRADDAEITTDQWRSLDATAYRLLRELIGPERTRTHEEVISHALMSQVVNDYPSPIAAPDPEATYNARQAANYLGVSHWILLADIRRSALPATYDGRTYSIKGADLPSIPDVPPADTTSAHTLDRLSCTLGALADMVIAERSRTTTIPGIDPLRDDIHVAPVVARVLAVAVVAARHGVAHVPLQDADRPLAIARYAEHALDVLGDVDRPSRLNLIASFAPPSVPRGPNEELEVALRGWARLAQSELARTIPSTEVLRDIANQARHLYAVSSQLVSVSFASGNLPKADAELVHTELRAAAQVMHGLQQQWEKVTTATGPSQEYVTATTALHATLSAIEPEALMPSDQVPAARRIDVDQALDDLRYVATDLAELTHMAAQLPEPLIRSRLLFAPARILPSTMERMQDRNHGRYVAIQLTEGTELIDAAQQGSSAALQVRAALEISVRTAPTPELSTQITLAEGISRREHEPAIGRGGPDLF